MNPPTVEELAHHAQEARGQLAVIKHRFLLHEATYDEMAAAAKVYCRAINAWHRAKYGKGKKLDYRAVLR